MHLDVDPSLPMYARGDQQRIRQVLLNLLYNAVKFTMDGSVTCSAKVPRVLNMRVSDKSGPAGEASS